MLKARTEQRIKILQSTSYEPAPATRTVQRPLYTSILPIVEAQTGRQWFNLARSVLDTATLKHRLQRDQPCSPWLSSPLRTPTYESDWSWTC